ncbi:nuclear transport factor 2 family protein [Glutamicibacter sp. Je.9.36]|uniref:nuclear transport factor 2 family protein n=1 Tax=Glutamicibacter sp. Je.9.36 TaxID=3142837 RepID=UPI003DA96D9F
MSETDLNPSTLEDQIGINQLYSRYTHAIDDFDQQGWLDTFAEDGVFDIDGTAVRGRDQLSVWFSQFEDYSQKSMRHYISNIGISVDGTTAAGRAYLIVLNVSNGQLAATGTYLDSLSKSDGKWRFEHRELCTDAKAEA